MVDSPQPPRVYTPVPARSLDTDVVKVVRRLRRYDHEAYLVGGCVRDLLLEVPPKDFDVATSAKPREVRRIFRNSRVIGRRFQLVHVLFRDQKIIEVATFRQPPVANPKAKEGVDADLLITDDNVFGTDKDDAFRRDFTINALFYDVHTREIVDYVDGLADIESRTVRSIGDPDVRLREDPVRMLRAIKFASRLDLTIEDALWASIQRHRDEISKAAPPRLLEEIYRLFRPAVSVAAFRLLRDAGLWPLLLPQVAEHLDQGGEEAVQEYEAVLGALDGVWKMRNATAPDAQILMSLLWTPWKAKLDTLEAAAQAAQAADDAAADSEGGEGGGRRRRGSGRPFDLSTEIQDFLSPWMTGLRVPRRIQDRIRQVWMCQDRFDPGGGRRRKTDAFVRRRFFEEAVDFYEIRARAAGLDLASVDLWRARAKLKPVPDADRRQKPSEADAASLDGDEPQPTKRKRRGRRRRRGGGGGGGDGQGGNGEVATAEAEASKPAAATDGSAPE